MEPHIRGLARGVAAVRATKATVCLRGVPSYGSSGVDSDQERVSQRVPRVFPGDFARRSANLATLPIDGYFDPDHIQGWTVHSRLDNTGNRVNPLTVPRGKGAPSGGDGSLRDSRFSSVWMSDKRTGDAFSRGKGCWNGSKGMKGAGLAPETVNSTFTARNKTELLVPNPL